MTGQIESDLLRTFLAVARTGSMSAGAEHIFRSQSAVSLQIKQLETTVGQPVFDRRPRGVRLTAAGENLLPVAEHVVQMLDETLSRLRPDPMGGSLRIGIPDEFDAAVLPLVLGAFAREHPAVELSVRCALSADFPDALKRGELDVAVYDTDRALPGQQLIRRQRAVWATSRLHAIHLRNPVPLALFDRDCWWRDHATAALRRAGIEFRIAYSSESDAGIVAALEAGIGVGLLAEGSLTADLVELSEKDGFPAMPETALVIERRKGVEVRLADAMADAIAAAFA
jgi:DNA-binding transcriptional LysR family regulator